MKTIEEIMGLVDEVEDLSAGIMMANEHSNCASEEEGRLSQVKKEIESALRELVERKPLSDEALAMMENKCWANTVDKGLTQFAFVKLLKDKIEAHHGIGA